MSTSSTRLVSLLLLAIGLVGAGDAMAQRRADDRRDNDRSQDRESRGHDRREDHRALSDAVRRVERRSGGQVLSAERVPFDGRDVNRVKVVDSSGRVRVYMDDPSSAGSSAGRGARDEPPRTRGDDD